MLRENIGFGRLDAYSNTNKGVVYIHINKYSIIEKDDDGETFQTTMSATIIIYGILCTVYTPKKRLIM